MRRALVAAGGSPNLSRVRRRAAVRSRGAHTTRALRAEGSRSRGGSGFAERLEIAPLVRFRQWVLVVGGVRGIDLPGAMTSQQRRERFIEQCRVSRAGACAPRSSQQRLVNSCTYSDSCHATSMPQTCHEPSRTTVLDHGSLILNSSAGGLSSEAPGPPPTRTTSSGSPEPGAVLASPGREEFLCFPKGSNCGGGLTGLALWGVDLAP